MAASPLAVATGQMKPKGKVLSNQRLVPLTKPLVLTKHAVVVVISLGGGGGAGGRPPPLPLRAGTTGALWLSARGTEPSQRHSHPAILAAASNRAPRMHFPPAEPGVDQHVAIATGMAMEAV